MGNPTPSANRFEPTHRRVSLVISKGQGTTHNRQMNLDGPGVAWQQRDIATWEGLMEKTEKQVLWELVKLRKAMLKKEPDPSKKRVLREWIRDGLRQIRVQKRARRRAFTKRGTAA